MPVDTLLFRTAQIAARIRAGARSREFYDREGRSWWIYHSRPPAVCCDPGVPIVFLHGFGNDGRTWFPFFPPFRHNRELVSVDIPGFGRSELLPADDPTPSWYADRLSFLLQDFVVRWGQPPIIVGKSMGGMLAGLVAAREPNLVRALLLVAPAGVETPTVSPFWSEWASRGRNMLLPADAAEYAAMIRLLYERPVRIPGFVRRVVLREIDARRDHYRWIFERLLAEGYDPLGGRLRDITTPTVLVHGEHDRIVDPSIRRVFSDRFPRARIDMVPACGHSPTRERREAVIGALVDILSRYG